MDNFKTLNLTFILIIQQKVDWATLNRDLSPER